MTKKESPPIPGVDDADFSMRGVGLFERVGGLRDLNKLIIDAVWNDLYDRNVNVMPSRGAFVEPLKRSSEDANYAVHVAIDDKHAVVRVVVPRSKLELHEKLVAPGMSDPDFLLSEY